MRLAIVGATGMVGRIILKVLEERKINITELFLVASESSVGKKMLFLNKEYKLIRLVDLLKKNLDLALFSAGAEIAKEWAPKLAERGVKVIDNSSYFRMKKKHKLIIPEINGEQLQNSDMIIANPNCSTIQLLMPLAALHKKFIIQRVIVSTYQSVSGTGMKAIQQLKNEEEGMTGGMIYPHPIYQNTLPHCDVFQDNGYTKEEIKLTMETKKILDNNIEVSATAVRVPVSRGHSESVNITFEKEFKLKEIYSALENSKGVIVADNILKDEYPMPINVKDKDEVFVGRIRRDFSFDKSLNLWIVADNLRKGAATNTVQIIESLLEKKIVK